MCVCLYTRLTACSSELSEIKLPITRCAFNIVRIVKMHKQKDIIITQKHPLKQTKTETHSLTNTQAGGTRHFISYSTPSPHPRHPHIPLWPPQHSTHSHYSNLTRLLAARGLITSLQHLSENSKTHTPLNMYTTAFTTDAHPPGSTWTQMAVQSHKPISLHLHTHIHTYTHPKTRSS